MADAKISALADIVTLAAGDKIAVADASDLTASKSATMTEVNAFILGSSAVLASTAGTTITLPSVTSTLATTTYAPSCTNGIATKNVTDASATQNIAHGLGRVPKFVHLVGTINYAAGQSQICNGFYNGTTNSGSAICMAEGTSTAVADAVYTSTTKAIGFSTASTVSPFGGATSQTGIVTVDATNIIITWTKTGTVSSIVANILWMAM